MNLRGERGAVAVGTVALLLVLALVAGAGLRAGRALVLDERVHGSADAVALAAAAVLERGYGDAVDAGGSPAAVHATEDAARAAAAQHGRRLGLTLESIAFERGAHDPSPLARARAGGARRPDGAAAQRGPRIRTVRRRARASASPTCAAWMRAEPSWRRRSRNSAGRTCGAARAGPRADSTARAWIDYALAAAGVPVGRLTAAGLQQLARPLAHRCSAAGRRSRVRRACRRTMSASWSRPGWPSRRRTAERASASSRSARAAGPGRGRLLLPGAAAATRRDGELAVPAYVPAPLRALIARAARAEQLPPALLAAQLEAESGFDAAARSAPGARGHRAVHAGDLGGDMESAARAQPVRARAGDCSSGAPDARPARAGRRRHRDRPGRVQRGACGGPADWPGETRAYIARILRRFGGPATLGAALPPEFAAAGAPLPAAERRCVCCRNHSRLNAYPYCDRSIATIGSCVRCGSSSRSRQRPSCSPSAWFSAVSATRAFPPRSP